MQNNEELNKKSVVSREALGALEKDLKHLQWQIDADGFNAEITPKYEEFMQKWENLSACDFSTSVDLKPKVEKILKIIGDLSTQLRQEREQCLTAIRQLRDASRKYVDTE